MKLKIFCISILAVILALPSLCFSQTPDPKVWEYLVTDSKGHVWYYNKTNINRSSDSITVWTYTTVTDQDRKDAIDMAKEYEDYKMEMLHKQYSHDNTLYGIDCRNKRLKVIETIEFDDKGNVIDDYKYGNIISWIDINLKDIIFEKLFNTFCKTQEKTVEKK
jgi:hypothetical protein